jgi:sugar/nucleoside kinase (ribokinase family)
MENTLPYVDIFLPSVEEAFFIFDRDEYMRIKELSNGDDFTRHINMGRVKDLGAKLIRMGCAIAVIKCGAKGIYVKAADGQRLKNMGLDGIIPLDKWAAAELFEESYEVADFKSALAAGDTAIAGFLSGVIKGYGAVDCAKTAAKAGALCCTAYDALSGVASLEETQKHIKDFPGKNRYEGLDKFFEHSEKSDTWFSKK